MKTGSQTEETIRTTARHLFARYGYEGVSMRILARESGVGLSSIYHFFADKDVLLKAVYLDTNRQLGAARAALKPQPTAERSLTALMEFQFAHIEEILFVLKYYMHFRQDFATLPTRTLPPKSALHIEEILHKGNATGEFQLSDDEVQRWSKVVAHVVNGYLIEYYPDVPRGQERRQVIDDIVLFSMRGLRKPR